MFCIIMNNSKLLHIPENASRTTTIKMIKDFLSSQSGVVYVDLIDASFPLHRDFFLVLSKKFPKDRYILRVKHEKIATLAHSLGIQAEVVGLNAEFERTYSWTNLATHNMTMWEYFVYEVRRAWLWLKFVLFERQKKEKILYYKKRTYHVFLIVLWLILSFTLLLFIFNFAISKSTILITPEISVKPITANIIYKQKETETSIIDTKNYLELRKIFLPIELSTKYKVTSVDPSSAKNARWVVTIYNELTVAQDLRPSTRFVAPDGSVFRTVSWVKIPASRSLNWITEMWVVEVELLADTHDESGKLIAERWNIIQWTDLVIPGLKFNRDKIYAKAKADFTGWAQPEKHILTEEEFNSFKNNIADQLNKNARLELEKKLENDKSTTWDDFALLIADAIKLENIEYNIVSGQKVGDIVEEIELKATANIIATVLDKKATIEHLTNIFREKLLRWTDKELSIHPETLHITQVINRSEWDLEIKATVEMNASTTYDFENMSNEYVRQMKTIITGLSQKEAEERLLSENQIQEVQITTYPFWIRNIPSSLDNIEFVIKK